MHSAAYFFSHCYVLFLAGLYEHTSAHLRIRSELKICLSVLFPKSSVSRIASYILSFDLKSVNACVF